MNIIAPLPKKPSSYSRNTWLEDDEACQELRQILNSHSTMMEEFTIARTHNPLPNDKSFTPIQQAVSHLSVADTSRIRPRSFSVGDSKSFTFNSAINLVH